MDVCRYKKYSPASLIIDARVRGISIPRFHIVFVVPTASALNEPTLRTRSTTIGMFPKRRRYVFISKGLDSIPAYALLFMHAEFFLKSAVTITQRDARTKISSATSRGILAVQKYVVKRIVFYLLIMYAINKRDYMRKRESRG